MADATHILNAWAALYSNSAILRTLLGFAHVAGLVTGGGCAIMADRATLRAYRGAAAERQAQLPSISQAHAIVIAGLAAVLVSGALLAAADADTMLHSVFFWIKMGLVVLLLMNGGLMRAAAHAAARRDAQWPRLAATAGTSLALWMLTTLAGAALPNVQ